MEIKVRNASACDFPTTGQFGTDFTEKGVFSPEYRGLPLRKPVVGVSLPNAMRDGRIIFYGLLLHELCSKADLGSNLEAKGRKKLPFAVVGNYTQMVLSSCKIASAALRGSAAFQMGRPTTMWSAPSAMALAGVATRF